MFESVSVELLELEVEEIGSLSLRPVLDFGFLSCERLRVEFGFELGSEDDETAWTIFR